MKRMIAFLIAVLGFLGIKVSTENRLPSYNFEKIVVVSKKDDLFESQKIKNGNQFYYSFDFSEGKEVLSQIKVNDFDGLVFYLDKNSSLNAVLNNLDFCFKGKSEIENLQTFYGYDKNYHDFRIVDNKKVNVQVVVNSTNIVVGYPLILCSYWKLLYKLNFAGNKCIGGKNGNWKEKWFFRIY